MTLERRGCFSPWLIGKVVAANELLASFRFDRVPAGDAGWAVTEARKLLPPAVEPAKFPVPPGSFQSLEQ